mmetsp:Transcript_2218/g.2968  ORF Transcript_2218/g.2968 Transcript_2218/m.2968 type:complete len:98 (-) Transcript_2218:1-294(-)
MRYYTCRLCRTELFNESSLGQHQKRQHSFSFHKSRSNLNTNVYDACASYFLNSKTEWMGEMKENEAKISCPKETCKATLGSFHWSGSQCSCNHPLIL